MRRNRLRYPWLILGVGLCVGCGASDPTPATVDDDLPRIPEKPKVFQLDGPVEISLVALLAEPRDKLASQADELAERIRIQEKKHREGEMPYNLLPDWRLPLATPIFRQAKYSAKLGMSFPSYLNGVESDPDVARHLASYGDSEGALKLTGPSDAAARKEIEEARFDKNYPLEWTRLVALHLHVAQVRLATGDEEGGRRLVGLHQQLLTVLDAKARASLLGATLLPRGRGALAAAAEAWQNAKQPELASQADAILAKWGTAHPWAIPALAARTPKNAVARALRSKGEGHALAASVPARAFDLFSLPFPDEGVDSVVVCFNGADELAEISVIYRPSVFMLFPRPEQLAQVVEDWGLAAKDLPAAGSVKRRSYALGDLGIEVAVVPDHTSLGALARLGSSLRLKKTVTLARELGPVHLDESFEQNRLRFAPGQKGKKLAIDQPDNLKKVTGILGPLEPTEASIEGDPTKSVVSRFTLRAAPTRHGFPLLGAVALPFWEKGGGARLETTAGKEGYALALVWEDEKTRFVLTLPHGKREDARLEVTDRTSAGEMSRHAAEATAKDRAARRLRIERKKPLVRIMRVREKVRLGMTEQEVVKAFPDGDGFTRRKVPGGLGLVINVIPEKSPGYIPREVFVRFGPEKVVAEVRVRYTSQPGIKGGVNNLLQEIGASCGAAHELGGSWTRVWSEYPQRTPAPRMYRWEDDVTIMTCQRDSEGVELTLLDRPLDFEKGVKLGAFQCLSEGPRNCTLGMTKAELVELWKDSKPTFEDNVLIVTAPVESSYSQIQAFFKDSTGLVTRVVALHAQKWDKDPGQEKLEEAVQGAWERGKESLGFYRRMDLTMNDTVQSLTSHDDVRRVCVFWQETKAGPRLYTEWTRIEKAQK